MAEGRHLEGKVGFITGVGQNIGLATAKGLARAGATVVVNDVDPALAEQVVQTLTASGAQCFAVRGDVTDRASVQAAVDEAIQRAGRIDILVNNAGKSSFAPFLEMSEELWDRELDANTKGTFLVSQAVARTMVARGGGGRIISLASAAAESARLGGASHCASKAGIVMLTKVMAMELAPYGITANAVSPGLVPSPRQSSSPAYREAYKQMIPLGRLGEPEDIARAILFLASDDAQWITGEIIHVDGGFLAGRTLPSNIP